MTMKKSFLMTLLLSALASVVMAAPSPHQPQDPQLTMVLNAIRDCQPECAIKQYEDFKNNLSDTFDQNSGCEEKFTMYLKQKKLDTQSWYHRECISQCMSVIQKEFADNEDVKGQIGSGAFGFWASKGAITTVEQVCAR